MKFIITIIISVMILGLWSIRVYQVNSKAEKAKVEVYPKNTAVSIDKNFFWNENEIAPGYTVKVVDSRVVTADDYINELGLTKDAIALKNTVAYYVVDIIIKNESNPDVGEAGISFLKYNLVGDNCFYSLPFETDIVYDTANPSMVDIKMFSLRVGDEKVFTLPFPIIETYTNDYENDPMPKLEICEYPVKKLLMIE